MVDMGENNNAEGPTPQPTSREITTLMGMSGGVIRMPAGPPSPTGEVPWKYVLIFESADSSRVLQVEITQEGRDALREALTDKPEPKIVTASPGDMAKLTSMADKLTQPK